MSEIDIPQSQEYKTITPFKLFVKSNFPFIENTYEALDNYGLYCKIVEYLNNVIDEQNKVSEDMTTFTDFVTNYFENLDVQEEINNKLDEMAESGVLQEIVNEIFETIENDLSNLGALIRTLETRMNSFTHLQEGSTTGDAELIDGRISYSGLQYDNIGDSIRGQTNINIQKNKILNEEQYRKNYFDGIYRQGGYVLNDGTFNPNTLKYVSGVNNIYVGDNNIIKVKDLPSELGVQYIYILFFAEDDSYIGNQLINNDSLYLIKNNTHYINFSIRTTNYDDIKPTQFKPITIYLNNYDLSGYEKIEKNLSRFSIPLLSFYNYIFNGATTTIGGTNTRIGTLKPFKFTKKMKVKTLPGYDFSVNYFSDTNKPTAENYIRQTNWLNNEYIINENENIIFNMKKTEGGEIYPEESINLILEEIHEENLSGNYSIDSAFNKKNLEITEIGNISSNQSFCIYNNKIYSTNGSKISVQNLETMELENEVEINVGHGNSFQIGSSNLGYISGWDDNKIYVINMDTLTLERTINLPTTGYTTSAIDDINKLAYIFQRNSFPDTEENYNFIVYDYENDTIIKSKKTTTKFGGMQACDFLHGKIIVLNGFGSNTNPNYYYIYDTECNVIGELVLGQFATGQEPEGIYIDRITKEIYISYQSGKIYKIK